MIQDNFYLKAISPAASNEWVRNPDWLPLPEFAPSDNRMVLLTAVYEGLRNFHELYSVGTGQQVNWGDGTVEALISGYHLHEYDYSAMSGSVFVDHNSGRNYKQALVDVTFGSSTFVRIGSPSSSSRWSPCYVLDAKVQSSTLSFVDWATNRRMPVIEKVDVRGSNLTHQGFTTNVTNIREILFDFNQSASLAGFFQDKLKVIEFPSVTLNSTNVSNFFFGSGIEICGDLELSSTNISAMFQNSSILSIGNINAPNATNMSNFVRNCKNLMKLGTINAPNVTNLTSAFAYGSNINEIVFTNLANVTTTSLMFYFAFGIQRFVCPGLTRGFDISGNAMSETALNEMFTSLGTASGSQTIIVTGNPGAATCDTSIATAKGFSVTI